MKSHPNSDDLAAFALGALDPKEQESVSDHVDGCERCAAELRERLIPAVRVLAESVEQVEPPPGLRQSLMATVHEEAGVGAELENPRPRPSPKRSRLGAFLMRPAVGLATLALIGAAIGGYVAADGDQVATETVALPNSVNGAGGTLVVEGDAATLHMHDMASLDKGDVYQVWVAGPSGVKPSAAFVPHSDGSATAAVPEAAGDVDQVMITRESRAGVEAPTLNQIVFDARID
jgi:anti-sigma factor RsiW